MADFRKRGGFSGGKSFGRRDFGGSRDSRGGNGGGSFSGSFGGGASRSRFNRPGNRDFRKTQMFSAICAECSKSCEVPFRPNGDKPVYCNYCFNKNKPGEMDSKSSFNKSPRKDFSSNSYSSNPVNASNTPIARNYSDNSQINEIKKQLDTLNTKIDKLMELISKNSLPAKESEVKVEKAEKKTTKRAVAKKK